jgi:uncharacterized RDD family membrane protein YckC
MNMYRAPQANVDNESNDPASLELAGRGTRFAAVWIDGLISGLIMLPFLFMFGLGTAITNAEKTDPTTTILVMSIGLITVIGFQFYFLNKTGQTLGKKIMKIRIADYITGQKPSVWKIIGLRIAIPQIIGMIPVIGALFSLINILFIFREDRRCIHDLICGTQVVKA